MDKAAYPDDYPADGLAIDDDTHRCEHCGHEFGAAEHERLYAMYQYGSLLGGPSPSDLCPSCGSQLIKWVTEPCGR